MIATLQQRGRMPSVRAGDRPFAACGIAIALCLVMPAAGARAADDTAATAPTGGLAGREQQLVEQFRELEKSFLRLADLLAGTDPRRAALLRGVFEQARDAEVGDRLDTIVQLLEKNQFLKAGTSQADAIDRMKELLALLESGDADKSLANTKEEVRQFIARVAKLIAKQRDIEGSTESGSDGAQLATRQESLAEETRALAGDIGGFAKRMQPRDTEASDANGGQQQDGTKPGEEKQAGKKPKTGRGDGGDENQAAGDKEGQAEQGGEGEPGTKPAGSKSGGQGNQPGKSPEDQPGEQADDGAGKKEGAGNQEQEGDDEGSRAARTRDRLQAAEERMRRAQKQLDEAQRRDARAEQEKAIEELETARAELEEILRQMREEEVERLLVQLETRIRGMLRAERAVLAGVEKVAADSGPSTGRERQLEAARLGRDQTAIGNDAAKALALVRDDGSAVAIPQALEQVREDAAQAAARLTRGDVGGTTRGIVEDLVASLEEMLAALEKAQREQQARKENPSGGRPAEPGEQPLVDQLAELKMIRSLQMRVNTRTQRFAKLLADDAEQADEPELINALERLAERQRSIRQAAHDIVTGRTE